MADGGVNFKAKVCGYKTKHITSNIVHNKILVVFF